MEKSSAILYFLLLSKRHEKTKPSSALIPLTGTSAALWRCIEAQLCLKLRANVSILHFFWLITAHSIFFSRITGELSLIKWLSMDDKSHMDEWRCNTGWHVPSTANTHTSVLICGWNVLLITTVHSRLREARCLFYKNEWVTQFYSCSDHFGPFMWFVDSKTNEKCRQVYPSILNWLGCVLWHRTSCDRTIALKTSTLYFILPKKKPFIHDRQNKMHCWPQVLTADHNKLGNLQ